MPRIARWIILFAALALVPVVPAFAAESDPPTATFARRGAPPLTCGSKLDVHSLTVRADTRLLLINETDVDATVVVDNEDILDVPDGRGVLLALPPGIHVITMVPACLRHAAAEELTVTVTAGADSTAPTVAELPSTETRGEVPSAATASMGAPYPHPAMAGAGVNAPTDPSRPSLSASASPSATSKSNVSAAWRGVDATLVDLGRSQSPGPRWVTVVVLLVLFGVIVATVRALIRSRHSVKIGRRGKARLASDLPASQQSGGDAGSADELRDRLRELVQAAHHGAGQSKIEAARAELFAQHPRPDEKAEA